MKKAWWKLYCQELICDFVMCGLSVLLVGGFLLSHIMKAANKQDLYAEDIRLIGFSIATVFVIILISGIYLYKISASYVRWYKGILDSIPMPVIVTDKDACWRQINKAARDIMDLEPDSEIKTLNSKHLIDTDGGVMKKKLTHKGIEYRISGNRLYCNGKDEGHLIILNHTTEKLDASKTRMELIDETNRLLKRMSTTRDKFHDCASTLVGCTVRQADIITELSDVIVRIVSGEFKELDTINKKMYTVKVDMQQHVESSTVYLEKIQRTVEELDATRDSIGGVIHNIDSNA